MHARPLVPRILVVASIVGPSLVATAPPAGAVFHLTKIREVFAGVAAAPAAQFVELQMSMPLQNQVTGKEIRVFNASGALVDTFTFTTPVPVPLDQSSILVATPAAETFFGVEADLEMDAASIPAGGGKVCYHDPAANEAIDCVAWGSYSGPAAGVGTPFDAPEGIPAGAAIERRTGGGTNPEGLDPADDTGDSASDFGYAAASPRNNLGSSGSAPGGALSFGTAAKDVGEGAGSAAIPVSRSDGGGTVGASVLRTGGTATPGADFTLADGTLDIPPQTSAELGIVDDARVEPEETIKLALRNPTGGAVLGSTIDAIVTIADDEPPDVEPPVTEIARPKHGRTYRASKLTAFRGESLDVGSDVALVEIALRQKRVNGDCRWWNGERFILRPCGLKLFQTAGSDADWGYDLGKRLKPSVGTKIRSYTLFARAVDSRNNVEKTFEGGRNRNRFEVT